ncbi:hypothetical protein [Actinoplanes utahensis]|uniref:hypothetical protein n=1 Tax=Actinoplanes utahensis TaxID=1869 RepID=UPI00137653EC|nr:hypothetical protein [Actinoplanes utahensis]
MTLMRLLPLAVLALPVLSLTACGSGVGANDHDPSAVQAAYDELYTACEAAGAPWGVK